MDQLIDRLPDVAQRDLMVKVKCRVDCKIDSRSKLELAGAMVAQIHVGLLGLIPAPLRSWQHTPKLSPVRRLSGPGGSAMRRSCLM